MTHHHETVLVIDFGAQYAQLIARRIREHRVFAHILPCTASLAEIKALDPIGIILSGGPASVYDENAPVIDPRVLESEVPLLGICYGAQLLARHYGGDVVSAPSSEYGPALLDVHEPDDLFADLPGRLKVWMSHRDQVTRLPRGGVNLGGTASCPIAAFGDGERRRYGVQFHPEVSHTPQGSQMLKNFLFRICGAAGDWKMSAFIDDTIESVRQQTGDANVVLGLSGGVDSSVVAVLLQRAIGDRLHCIFVDTGLLRAGEYDHVIRQYREHFHLNLIPIQAGDRFLAKLAGVTDPERKRKIIGHEFIAVFEEEAHRIDNVRFLAQGTLYPDVIESAPAHGGPTAMIKSHHNVGGLPEKLGLQLIEPLRDLFKDEVRKLGEGLGMPEALIWRHPFPGPGLAIRIIGEVTPERVALLQKADRVVLEEIHAADLYRRTWQAFAVLLPVASVGVMGDERTYENTIALRIVDSQDGMTADWSRLPYPVLAKISNRIINEVRGINRVVYDISSKPPGTIEWE